MKTYVNPLYLVTTTDGKCPEGFVECVTVVGGLHAREFLLAERVEQLLKDRESAAVASATLRDESIAKSERIIILESAIRDMVRHPMWHARTDEESIIAGLIDADSPILTEAELRGGVWRIGGKIVSREEGLAAFREAIRRGK